MNMTKKYKGCCPGTWFEMWNLCTVQLSRAWVFLFLADFGVVSSVVFEGCLGSLLHCFLLIVSIARFIRYTERPQNASIWWLGDWIYLSEKVEGLSDCRFSLTLYSSLFGVRCGAGHEPDLLIRSEVENGADSGCTVRYCRGYRRPSSCVQTHWTITDLVLDAKSEMIILQETKITVSLFILQLTLGSTFRSFLDVSKGG